MINQPHFRTKYKISYKPPPKNVEEFIKSQNWDSWPRDFIFSDKEQWLNDLKKLKEDCTFAEIYSHLWSNVPRIYDASINMETRLEECSTIMKKHASKIFEGADLDISTFALEKFLRYKSFMKKYKQKKIMISSEMETKKNVEGFNFAGFKASEITPLPRHLDAERIYLFILKSHNLDAKLFKIWKSYILSPSSIALLIDSFWWWFLHKFKPDRENQAFLFDRMSESYAMLFMSIPINRKDVFIQVYPDCLSQAIYAAFQEAFPESCELFDEEFIEELGNTVFLWLSGLKPQKHFWTHWKLHDLSTRTIHGVNKVTSKSVLEKIAKNKQQISTCK
ncbi:protein FAM227B [Suncus etruscus]|uniref:protein FAM227B n=1 Tax=Suncus etruscus TaxID=109475 RepID=UPI0021100A3D|nr:protein FAM227B [Suncus etruscus]